MEAKSEHSSRVMNEVRWQGGEGTAGQVLWVLQAFDGEASFGSYTGNGHNPTPPLQTRRQGTETPYKAGKWFLQVVQKRSDKGLDHVCSDGEGEGVHINHGEARRRSEFSVHAVSWEGMSCQTHEQG